MKVVCAACNLHYADIDTEMPFAEKLIYSDALALWHAPQCHATEEDHAAALAMVQAVEAADMESAAAS